jgi:hypothetical protein
MSSQQAKRPATDISLAEETEQEQPLKKRARRSKKKQVLSPSSSEAPSLNEDALGLVMQFLSPRDLLRLAFTCNALQQKLSTTLVVRSALMSGGNGAATIKELYPLMKSKSIHPPSPQRLLRLVNGKLCEHCLSRKVNHIRPHYGVLVCWDCLTENLTTMLRQTSRDFKKLPGYRTITEYERVVANRYGTKLYCWANPLTSRHGQVKIGPLVTFGQIERAAHAYKNDIPIEALFDENSFPPESDYQEFVTAYEESKEDAKGAQKYRMDKKANAKRKTAQVKMTKSLEIVAKLQVLLDEPWNLFCLQHEPTHWTGKSPCLRFHSPLVYKMLEEYVTSPSKAKPKVLKEIASKLNGHFGRALELLDFEWLLDRSPPEIELHQHCQRCFRDLSQLILNPMANTVFFELVAAQQPSQALQYLIYDSIGDGPRFLRVANHAQRTPDDDSDDFESISDYGGYEPIVGGRF